MGEPVDQSAVSSTLPPPGSGGATTSAGVGGYPAQPSVQQMTAPPPALVPQMGHFSYSSCPPQVEAAAPPSGTMDIGAGVKDFYAKVKQMTEE